MSSFNPILSHKHPEHNGGSTTRLLLHKQFHADLHDILPDHHIVKWYKENYVLNPTPGFKPSQPLAAKADVLARHYIFAACLIAIIGASLCLAFRGKSEIIIIGSSTLVAILGIALCYYYNKRKNVIASEVSTNQTKIEDIPFTCKDLVDYFEHNTRDPQILNTFALSDFSRAPLIHYLKLNHENDWPLLKKIFAVEFDAYRARNFRENESGDYAFTVEPGFFDFLNQMPDSIWDRSDEPFLKWIQLKFMQDHEAQQNQESSS